MWRVVFDLEWALDWSVVVPQLVAAITVDGSTHGAPAATASCNTVVDKSEIDIFIET